MDKWCEPKRFRPVLIAAEESSSPLLSMLQALQENHPPDDIYLGPLGALVAASKEIIFDASEVTPRFVLVTFALNARTGNAEIGPTLSIQGPGARGDDAATQNWIREILAMAYLEDTPVFPNTATDATILARHHRDMLQDGFSVELDGKKANVRLAKPGAGVPANLRDIETLDPCQLLTPAITPALSAAVLRERERQAEVASFIGKLRLGVDELKACLDSPAVPEAELQACLTRNPILFGLEYQRVLPKHSLGAEYEMDYALERRSGWVDLVEIEASSHKLFNKKGDPTAPLVHAEQQILDWLAWIEQNHAYARQKLPGLIRPTGYVIIGRSCTLADSEKHKLRVRNRVLDRTLEVLTYDDFLARAENLLSYLEPEAGEEKTAAQPARSADASSPRR